MDIPEFPLSRGLNIEDKTLFDSLFVKYPSQISEFTFTNLYIWRNYYKFEVSRLGDLVVIFSVKNERLRFLEPLGNSGKVDAVLQILKEGRSEFIRIPEEAKLLLESFPEVEMKLDRDNCDYLYRLSDLVDLPGKDYDAKRNFIRRFKSENTYEYIELDNLNISSCLEFEERWCTVKDCDSVEGLNNERLALKELADSFSRFSLMSGAIRINRQICAVAIAEKLNANTLVMHILKADANIPGLYQAMLHEFLSRKGAGFGFVNLEQDLGVEGLRKSKLSYHPFKLINKYTIYLRP